MTRKAEKCLKKALYLISFDCTEECNTADYVEHLSIDRASALHDVLVKENNSDNGKQVVYVKFVPIANEHGFMVSYDGMETEIQLRRVLPSYSLLCLQKNSSYDALFYHKRKFLSFSKLFVMVYKQLH